MSKHEHMKTHSCIVALEVTDCKLVCVWTEVSRNTLV